VRWARRHDARWHPFAFHRGCPGDDSKGESRDRHTLAETPNLSSAFMVALYSMALARMKTRINFDRPRSVPSQCPCRLLPLVVLCVAAIVHCVGRLHKLITPPDPNDLTLSGFILGLLTSLKLRERKHYPPALHHNPCLGHHGDENFASAHSPFPTPRFATLSRHARSSDTAKEILNEPKTSAVISKIDQPGKRDRLMR